jgi:hypothetical protein
MNNDEYLDDDACYDAMLEQSMQNDYFKGEIVANPMLALKTSDNWENYQMLLYLMANKQALTLSIGLDGGVPYYRTELQGLKRSIYITKEIRRQVYNYLIKGVIPDQMPEVYEAFNKMDETFILYHLKADRENKATRYKEEAKEYYAKYPNGTINYEQQPYTKDELVAKLNSLQ